MEIERNNSTNSYGLGSVVSIDAKPMRDGKYKLANSDNYCIIKNNIIYETMTEKKYTNPDGKDIFIQQHDVYNAKKGDYVFINGVQVEDGTINFSKSKNLVISDGKIIRFESKRPIAKRILYILIGLIIILTVVAIVFYIYNTQDVKK